MIGGAVPGAFEDGDVARRDWKNAAIAAGNLSELTLTLGEVVAAVEAGEESVDLADRSGDAFMRIAQRATLADALHQAGRRRESAAAFRETEALQAKWQPLSPRLYSVQGYLLCDLLLARAGPEDGSGLDGMAGGESPLDPPFFHGERPEAARSRAACEQVRDRAAEALRIVLDGSRSLLAIALNEFAVEVDLLRKHHEFLAFLDECKSDDGSIPLDEIERLYR